MRQWKKAWLMAAAAVSVVGVGAVAAPERPPAGAAAPADPSAGPASPTGLRPGPAAPGQPAGSRPTRPPASSVDRATAVADAAAAVTRNRAAVRGGPAEKYQARSVLVDPDGARHVRFDRTYRDLPVLGGDYVVHSNPDGSLHDTTVGQDGVIAVSTEPAVAPQQAASAAATAVGGAVTAAPPALVVDATAGDPVLAWQVEVLGGAPRQPFHVVVDATSGAVRRSLPTRRTAAADGTGHGVHSGEVRLTTDRRDDGTFRLTDPTRGNGETRDARNRFEPAYDRTEPFTDQDNRWGDGTMTDRASAGADVHHGVQQTWDYFQRAHGRNGTADDGKGAVAYVHHDVDDGNAYWDTTCSCMRFGDGNATIKPFTSLDIVAHEMTHGVTAATAKFYYFGQQGALDEATSDIFGTLVEFAAQNPADPPDYLVGELLDDGADGRPLRYMDDPRRDGRSVSCWAGEGAGTDVHYLSGVPNKFFFMLAEGSGRSAWGDSPPCGNAPPVTGIGRDKAGAIWYRALTRYMVSITDFPEAREATLRAAADLHGATSAEYAAVNTAWKAVRVDGSDPKLQPPVVTSPGWQEGRIGDVVRLQIQATDRQGDALRFTAKDLPPGLVISESGLITGTLRADETSYPSVTVTDAAGFSTTVDFGWAVRGAPVITDPGPLTGALTRDVYLYLRAADRDARPAWSVTGLPDGVRQDQPGSDLLRGTPTRVGTFTVTATATDSENLSASVTFRWTVVQALPTGPPVDLTATRSGTDVTLSWDTPDTMDFASITGHEISASPGGATATTGGWNDRTVVLRGMDPAVAYTISVVTVNPAGRGEPATVRVPPV